MNQDNFLWGLQITDGLTMELVSQMTVIAFGVGVICFICNLAYNYLYHGASQLLSPNEDKFPDMMEIARCLVLFFCLSMYTPIARTIVGTMEVINEATSLTSDRAQEFAQFMAESATVQGEMVAEYDKHSLQSEISTGEDTTGAMQHELDKKAEEDEMTGVRSSVEKIVQLLNPANLATLVLHAIAALLVGIIQVIILGIGVVIVKILVILGPFVFAVSMLPVFQKQLSVWFGTLCSSCMVFTVINILNQIIWQTFKHIYTESADIVDAATQQIQYLGMDLALLGAYCSCFWLSSKIVGHSDAGKIISKAVSIVTTAATIALMGSAAAGSKLTNVGGAASIGESIINDNSKKIKPMNLMKFKGADNAVKLTIRLSAGYCIILTIAFVSCTVYLSTKIEKAYSQALVIDKQGEVYKTSSLSASDMRQYEYMNHVKTFVTNWYAFDESSYEKNISLALNLIGNKGKEMLNEYNDVNMLNSLIQKNIRYGVRIKDVEINTHTIPVSGKITFTQTGYRARGSISREIEAEFTIYDMLSRSEENAHGAKIEDWIVRYSEPVESDGTSPIETISGERNENLSESSNKNNHGSK